jgi:hypothetical protein
VIILAQNIFELVACPEKGKESPRLFLAGSPGLIVEDTMKLNFADIILESSSYVNTKLFPSRDNISGITQNVKYAHHATYNNMQIHASMEVW